MNRRGFLTALCAALAAPPDSDKLLWTPGKKLISIPSGKKLISVDYWSIWLYTNPRLEYNDTLVRYSNYAVFPVTYGTCARKSSELENEARERLVAHGGRYRRAIWFAENRTEKTFGEIIYA